MDLGSSGSPVGPQSLQLWFSQESVEGLVPFPPWAQSALKQLLPLMASDTGSKLKLFDPNGYSDNRLSAGFNFSSSSDFEPDTEFCRASEADPDPDFCIVLEFEPDPQSSGWIL